MEGFPFVTEIPMRFSDIDAMGHVNNAVYVTYFEMGRVAILDQVIGSRKLEEIKFVVARVEVDYIRPIFFSDKVQIGLRVSSIGKSSFTIEYLITANGKPAAKGLTVQVFYDYEKRAKMPVPADFRARVAPFLVKAS
jgi:acyl-CoA thioester hydrolase